MEFRVPESFEIVKMVDKTVQECIDLLRDDENYYGNFGSNFMSNSDIKVLLDDIKNFGVKQENILPFVIGGYFHTLVLEPHKIGKYKVINASTRNTNKYKELSDGEICLLQKDVDVLHALQDKLLSNSHAKHLIKGSDIFEPNIDYEEPGVAIIDGIYFKGKADVLNHDEKLIVDIKTTSNIKNFRSSAYKYGYDSQAYIYRCIFGYDMVFLAVDKNTGEIGLFYCSDNFYESGRQKVVEAISRYRTYIIDKSSSIDDFLLIETL